MGMDRTAYHEAGHAVACIAQGIKFRYVTIIPNDEGANGHIKYCMVRIPEYATNRTLIKHGIKTLAGTCAEKIKFGRYSHGFASDRENAVDYYIKAGIENVNPYFLKTETLLKNHWSKVERIAKALLHKKTLTYNEVITAI